MFGSRRSKKSQPAPGVEQAALPGMENFEPVAPRRKSEVEQAAEIDPSKVIPAPGPRAGGSGPLPGQMAWDQHLEHELTADDHGFFVEQDNEKYFTAQGKRDQANGLQPERGYAILGPHAQGSRKVLKAWEKVPVVHFPVDAPLHTTQTANVTEEDQGGTWNSRDLDKQYGSQRGTHLRGRSTINGIVADLSAGGQIREPVWLIKQDNRHFVLNGHHRIVAAREAGHQTVPARVLDLDANPNAWEDIAREIGNDGDWLDFGRKNNRSDWQGIANRNFAKSPQISHWSMNPEGGWQRGE